MYARAIALMILSLLPGSAIFAQPEADSVSFDVASVKPSKPGLRGISNRFRPNEMMWTDTPLIVLLSTAYQLNDFQILGAPGWARSDRWDVDAKSERLSGLSDRMRPLQKLLEERFHMQVHHETRDLPEYRLVTAKSGPRLQQTREGDPSAAKPGISSGYGFIRGNGMAVSMLAHYLSLVLHRPVLEATGITGNYDFNLEWSAEDSRPNDDPDARPVDPLGPSLFTAIQALGLKLEPIRGPVEVLIIDHVEKATAN